MSYCLSVVAVDTSATGGGFSDEQTVFILYIALAGADLILVILSIIMLFGVEPVICMHNLFVTVRAQRGTLETIRIAGKTENETKPKTRPKRLNMCIYVES